MKNRLFVGILFLGMSFVCTSCGKSTVISDDLIPSPMPEQSIEPIDTAEAVELLLGEKDALEIGEDVPEEDPEVTQEDEAQKITTRVYYGSKDFQTLVYEEVTVTEPIPESLINLLSAHNIVSVDTKVLGFEESTAEDGTKIISLDLSKGFSAYLSTMTEEGERVLVAALSDSFLEAFEADQMILTVEGNEIHTVNATYDSPLVHSDLPAAKAEDTVTVDDSEDEVETE